MKIRYSKHALDRLKQRVISKRLITEALINGQNREILEYEKIKCVYKFGTKKLIVIYKQDKEIYIIITSYYEN
ncbi:MAG: DUF4258 domain-containing protein [bacterium]|nr:DUF4258 domain-containing protein [bacterium]